MERYERRESQRLDLKLTPKQGVAFRAACDEWIAADHIRWKKWKKKTIKMLDKMVDTN